MRLPLLKRWLVGPPMPLAQARHERLNKRVALAVFSSDALSSVAYATEEILLVLVLAGAAAAHLTVPIALSITALLVIVAISYQQTIHAYPSGGGSYIVARANLGTVPGLIAAAALLVDYVLTVAVSVAAGVAAITSAFPELSTHKVALGVLCVAGDRDGEHPRRAGVGPDLRGAHVRLHRELWPPRRRRRLSAADGDAAAGGAVAGRVDGGADLVPRAPRVFVGLHGDDRHRGHLQRHPGLPAARVAQRGHHAGVHGAHPRHALRRHHGAGLGPRRSCPPRARPSCRRSPAGCSARGLFYYLIQASTALILVLAANTSFADFPRLASLLARDRFVPRQFASLGERLVFSNGILVLAGFAALLIVIFGGDTHALIPLYAVGVFISFTLSQAGMVRHWWRHGGPGWRHRLVINGVGALTTGLVAVVIAVTKFTHGAWIVVLVIPILVASFVAMRRHYDDVALGLSLEGFDSPPEFQHTVLVLIGDVHRGVVRAIQYARTLAPTAAVRAVYVETDPAQTPRLEEKWARWGLGVPLVVLTSPYRSLLRPLLDYVDQIQARGDDQMVTVVLPEFLPRRWWQHILHNQTALLVKGALLFRRNLVVADVPYLLKR